MEDKSIYDLLEEEHARLLQMCNDYESAPGTQPQIEGLLRSRIKAHCMAERATLYALLRRDAEAREVVEDCELQQDELCQLADQLELASNPDDKRECFERLVEVLRDYVQQEDGELLPYARGILNLSDNSRLGLMFEEERERWLE